MFGIGGGEMIFIIFIALMLFGTDKIPEIARGLGKGMAQLRNATNEIKNEIRKGTEEHGIDTRSLTSGITDEFKGVHDDFNKIVSDHTPESPLKLDDITGDITQEIDNARQSMGEVAGSIKRQS